MRKGEASAANKAKSRIFLIIAGAGLEGGGNGAFFGTFVSFERNKLNIAKMQIIGITNHMSIITGFGLKTIA